jgi:hypothetical protein
MINLLPPEDRQILFYEQTKRLAMILGNVVLLSMVCMILILLSVYFFIAGNSNGQVFLLRQITRDYQTSDFVGFKEIITKYNTVLPQILSFYDDERYYSDALGVIYSIPKPDGLSILNFSLGEEKSTGNEKGISVSISGNSSTREYLISYRDNILKEISIKNVSFSPESWVNQQNIKFSVTFDVIKNGK